MKKCFKRFISAIMVCSLLFIMTATAYAASTLHKTNGVYSDGEGMTYETKTSRQCYEIRVAGKTYASTTKYVNVVVTTSKNVIVASLYNVPLDGKTRTMTLWAPYNQTGFAASTYKVTVSSSDNKAYEISTYIYY